MRSSDAFLDTIVALATPAGRSALALVRISGKGARGVLAALAPRLSEPAARPRKGRLAEFCDASAAAIDTGVATFLPGPGTATGEDVVEISVHGSPLAVERLLAAAVAAGARPARPGEFTERAFRAGKLDLVRAEAVRDLIEARTPAAALASARRLAGGLSQRLEAVRQDLLGASVALTGAIDFAEDVGEAIPPAAREGLERAEAALAALAATARTGRLLTHGCRVAILGRPNAGKSTLFNALVGAERAIVTEIPGTTRDAIEATIDLDGVPVTLVDTAGLRETGDAVEALGVGRARAEAERADAIVYVFDAAEGLGADDARELAGAGEAPRILVANKSDLRAEGAAPLPAAARPLCGLRPEAGAALRALLAEAIAAGVSTDVSSEVLGSMRQADLVARAAASTRATLEALGRGESPEYAAAHCHAALDTLADLVGETTSDDVLDRLFSTFCIGK
jgi:tRNA modification GTPase